MRFVKKTSVEIVVLIAMALGVATVANAVRDRGSLQWSRNYFDKGPVQSQAQSATPLAKINKLAVNAVPESQPTTQRQLDTPADVGSAHPDHDYQEVSLEEVIEIFNDPNTEMGLNLFVDARNDAAYAEGHVPGAIQVDHYQLEQYIDVALEYADVADKVVVYCNGGNCEDSIFVCRDLIGYGVPYEKVFLFAGGWKEWTKAGMPVAKGGR